MFANSEDRHTCDYCGQVALDINFVFADDEQREEVHLCGDCYVEQKMSKQEKTTKIV